jgi:hypothetical protein
MIQATELHVDRGNLQRTRIATTEVECGDGEALLAVERFALTANNVTYAVAGESMGYWQFFPVDAPWGRVPVWGFARVVATKHPEVVVGERFYGYLPMATHVVVRPDRVGRNGFVDAAAHRQRLPPVYNQYQRIEGTGRDDENAQMLLRPLFMTSFLLEDYLAEENFFGARVVVLSSASSKTSIGLAFELARRHRGAIEVVGLTSPARIDFVEKLGYYDRCVPYDAVATLAAERPSAFVDMAGDADVLRRVHEHFRDALKLSCLVGVTHWQAAARTPPALPGPSPAFFFAPTRIQKRAKDWGAAVLESRLAVEWQAFVTDSRRWLRVTDVLGPVAMERAYHELLEGRTPAEVGIVVTPTGSG